MRFIVVASIAGRILRVFGAAFLAPAAVAALYGEWADVPGFVIGGLLCAAIGEAMIRGSRGAGQDLRRIEALAVVSGVWLMLALLCAVPHVWVGLPPIDALFEAMSGITATGATILTDFETPGRGFFFWRAMTQWLGGMGVIALVLAVLPRLAIGIRQLFFAEAPGPSEENVAPQIRKTAGMLWRFYAGLTAAEVVALVVAGMPLFDAVCHAFTNVAAGGFSPNAESIAGYNSVAIEWIVIVFMFLSGANFALQYRALLGYPGALFRDDEFRAYTGIVGVAAVALALLLWQVETAGAPIRTALFQVLSILTTTGYASTDFELWTDQTKVVLLAVMFIGGCAGSAAGGPKVLRHMLIGRFTLTELRRTLHLRGVMPGAHRIVGVGEIDERRIERAHCIEQGFEIDPVVAVGHRFQHPAEARDVVVERRVCTKRRDHRHPRLDDHPHHVAEHLVDAGPEEHLVDGDTVERRNRAAQVVCLGVVVPGDVRDRLAHGLGRVRRDPERALVRADADPERLATTALQRLGTDKRNRGRQAVDQTGEFRCRSHRHSLVRNPAREYPACAVRSRKSG